jgi:alpha-L-fucosidase
MDTLPAIDLHQRAAELQAMRFGMFVCWSISTFTGKEWNPGATPISVFAPTGFDPDQWARTARDAGMTYILLLAKHHDGFCLWDTRTTDRSVMHTALGRDVVAEVKAACARHGLKLALYFSEGDWTWPGAQDGHGGALGSGRDAERERAQLTELLTGYGPIEYLWVDHAAGTGGLSHAEFLAHCATVQPRCLVGFNHGDQQGTVLRIGERGKPGPLHDAEAVGPYRDPTAHDGYLVAEFTYPILPAHEGGADWFYSLPIHDGLCLPAERLIADWEGAGTYRNLFTLAVARAPDGRLREIDVRTLHAVGAAIRSSPTH